jgi:ABC-type nitrate/sulfonate/bicarbonate transport system permease component
VTEGIALISAALWVLFTVVAMAMPTLTYNPLLVLHLGWGATSIVAVILHDRND